jgi:hypothetical protein
VKKNNINIIKPLAAALHNYEKGMGPTTCTSATFPSNTLRYAENRCWRREPTSSSAWSTAWPNKCSTAIGDSNVDADHYRLLAIMYMIWVMRLIIILRVVRVRE